MPKINLYRNISLTFIVFAVMLLAVVFLFFSRQATILIVPRQQEINLSFNLEVKESPTEIELAEKDVVSGQLVTHSQKGQGEFSVLSTKTVQGDNLGQIKIVNESNRDQPLARTTQLQAANGVIVRTATAVTVPADGSVTVAVYAKEPDSFTPIIPGRLTIIKLNPALQDEIYGVTEQTLTDEPREVKVLSASDVNRAKEELSVRLAAELLQAGTISTNDSYVLNVKNYETSVPIGAETDNFILAAEVTVKVLEVDEGQLAGLLARKVGNLNITGLEIGKVNIKDLDYLIIEDDLAGSVLVQVNYTLTATINEENELLNKNNFVGRDIRQVKSLLAGQEMIAEVEILVSPYWQKTFPKQADKIKIIIRK